MDQSPHEGQAEAAFTLPWGRRQRDDSAHRFVRWRHALGRVPRLMLRVPILVYRYTLSSVMGRQCRYLPTCSDYADTAISRHGAWAGGWMGAARICRCHPWGGDGFDPVPQCLPADARWTRPWRYGTWRMDPPRDDEPQDRA